MTVSSTNSYLHYKTKFGSFWSLFLVGIASICNVKYCIMSRVTVLCLELILGYISTKSLTTLDIILLCKCVVIYYTLKWYVSFIEYLFATCMRNEQIHISLRITSYVNNLFTNASYKWHTEYPASVQSETLRDIHNSYDNMMFLVMHISTDIIDALNVLCLAFITNWKLGCILICSNLAVIKIKTLYGTTLSDMDDNIVSYNKELQLKLSNQFTQRTDIKYSPIFKSFYDESIFNPICGLHNISLLWNTRSVLSHKINLITLAIQSTFILTVVMSFYYYNNFSAILFISFYKSQLFTFVKIYEELENNKNIFGGRLLTGFKMIDDAYKEFKDEKTTRYTKVNKSLTIQNIHKKITDVISLVFNGLIHIDFWSKGIILLDGDKGCGKSVTMDILAGVYDDMITQYTLIDDIKTTNELRDLQDHIVYIRQLVGDDYRANAKRTVYMTLNELFPESKSYKEIHDYLMNFDITHKIPKDLQTIISKNERGLSPGETQTIILASQLWKALRRNVPLILLDEPERNIDYNTTVKIFDYINTVYFGTCVIVTHSNDLKTYLKPFIKSVWKFDNDHSNVLSFKVIF